MALGALVLAALSLVLSLLALRSGSRRPAQLSGAIPSLASEMERIDRLSAQVAALAGRLDAAEAQARTAMQGIGVVRFNPFEDTGSNQSFVLALLDARGDGFVLSSMHSRQQTRVFLKSVTGGKPETAISEEEAEAIRRAQTRQRGK